MTGPIRRCGLGTGHRAKGDRFRLESADQRAALSQLSARGSGPLLIFAPHPGRHSAGAPTL
jgi:hypothetical protein